MICELWKFYGKEGNKQKWINIRRDKKIQSLVVGKEKRNTRQCNLYGRRNIAKVKE